MFVCEFRSVFDPVRPEAYCTPFSLIPDQSIYQSAGRHALNVLYDYTRNPDLAIRRLNPQNNVHTFLLSVYLAQSRGPEKFTVASLYWYRLAV